MAAVMQPSPILLFGMPRSGTTWLGKVFDSHPETLYRHEPDTERPLSDLPLLAGSTGSDADAQLLHDYLDEMVSMRDERTTGKQPIFPKHYRPNFITAVYRLSARISKAAATTGWRIPVVGAGRPRRSAQVRLVWKSIESLGRLGLILWAFPKACSVQILRHPCGYVNSVLRGEMNRHFTHGGAAEDWNLLEMLCRTEPAVRREITIARLKMFTPEERLAWRWVIFNEQAAQQATASGRNLLVYYESLCFEPELVTRRLFEFCGLDWHAQTAAFLRASTETHRDDYYSVVKSPMDSAWKWQSQLERASAQRILNVMRQSALARPYFGDADWARVGAGLAD